MLEVTDDSGFLAIVVPANYRTFVDRNWRFDQLIDHFRQQMAQRSLLIWGTGLEGLWKVDVRAEQSSARGFREVSGPLRVIAGRVLVTNYESLAMVAQYDDEHLPQEHEQDQVVSLADGDYSCRIIQMFDPDQEDSADEGGADFIVELTRANVLPAPWSDVPWFSGNVA